jgi:hypothetical protein
MHQNHLFKTAFAIIFTLKPVTGIGPRLPRPFPGKIELSSPHFDEFYKMGTIAKSHSSLTGKVIDVS